MARPVFVPQSRDYAETSCPRHATWPRTRAAFWKAKLEGNKTRDRKVNRLLRAMGWTVLRIWQHELKRRDEAKLLRRLKKLL